MISSEISFFLAVIYLIPLVSCDAFFFPGQIHLYNTSILIVGAGGLGCPVAQYLAAAGVGMCFAT